MNQGQARFRHILKGRDSFEDRDRHYGESDAETSDLKTYGRFEFAHEGQILMTASELSRPHPKAQATPRARRGEARAARNERRVSSGRGPRAEGARCALPVTSGAELVPPRSRVTRRSSRLADRRGGDAEGRRRAKRAVGRRRRPRGGRRMEEGGGLTGERGVDGGVDGGEGRGRLLSSVRATRKPLQVA